MQITEKSINKEVQNWFDGDRDFNAGVALLEQFSPNMRTMIKHIRNKDTPENRSHLTYQLFKLSGLTDESICTKKIESSKPKVEEIIQVPVYDINKDLNHDDINEFDFGPTDSAEKVFYDQIVEFQKTCYNARAVTHKEMVALGDVNTTEIVAKRKALLQEIDNFTKIVDYLHQQKLSWKETGIKPDDTILEWKPDSIPEAHEEPNLNVDTIPDLDLQTQLSNVRSRLSKYEKKITAASGKKLEALVQKKANDELLKFQLLAKLETIKPTNH